MPGWLKALLAIAIIVVLLVVGVIVGAVVWWSRNKDKLLARGKEVMTEGRDFGRNTDNQGCVDESMSRYKKEPGFSNAISTSLFTRACLDASRPTPGFCSDVPKPTEFIKSGQWRVEQCRRVDLSKDSYCQQMFQPVQEFCQRESSKTSSDSNSQ
ncbi:MAG TPA: hypothetical protein VN956_24485 [Pyrinomonadaceae bacterium]|nr:hypothetical protein [Pyrinomonadaceae bacterium]